MNIFKIARTRLKFLGLVERDRPFGHLINIIQRSIGLLLTYSITILPVIILLFESGTFSKKSEACQALIVGATNSSFLVILILNRTAIFDMFETLERKIEERE